MLATDRTKPNQYVICVEILKCLYRPSGQDNNLIQDILLRTKDNEAAWIGSQHTYQTNGSNTNRKNLRDVC